MRRLICFVLLVLVPSAAFSWTWPPPVPATLDLTVRETAGIARVSEVVTSGIPLPRSWNLHDPATLVVLDASSQPVPAEFRVLGRWNAGLLDGIAPVQWLLVTFPASVAANGSARFRIAQGSGPAPATPLSISVSGNRVTVNTGAATFIVGGDSTALFDEIRSASGAVLVDGGDMTALSGGLDSGHPTTRQVRVERSGPLSAVVVIEGAYGTAAVGGGGLGSLRRYVFTAGSPTALVRQAVSWEGDRCGAGILTCGGSPNGLRLERVRDTLDQTLPSPRAVSVVGARSSAALSGTAAAGQEARLRQLLRPSRTAPLAFEAAVPGASAVNGIQADGGMLAVSTAAGAVAVALERMHRYEPQGLRLLADGRLALDLADGSVWLGGRQGMFANLAVSALPASPSRADLDRQVWAPLNRPLRAWPSNEWWAASGAVDEIPVGVLPQELQGYDPLVSQVLDTTLTQIDAKGIAGLMTFGLYPREWGLFFDELDCGDNDPTPGEAWDDKYWCGTWTDYHNTVATAAIRAERTGEVSWLDELAEPGALRMLHTQVMQCAPGDPWFYCGQAPAGYGGYRFDFNSSHAYFDNLFLYYWLTGDSTVVETLRRGASTMRSYLCSRRPAAPCLPTDPPADEWAFLTGRAAMQWFETFRFVGLAGGNAGDASYLDDWRSGLGRAATRHLAQLLRGGRLYGFWMGEAVNGPGTDSTDQLWMASLYDMNALWHFERETQDGTIGSPPLLPSGIQVNWARTLDDYGATVAPGGTGTAAGSWPNALFFNWTGERLGGTLQSVAANLGGDDPLLYGSGKACLTATMARAADATGDAALAVATDDLVRRALADALAELQPLGKAQGLYLSRLHAGVARSAARRASGTAGYYTLQPCRLADTRSTAPLTAGAPGIFGVTGICGVPISARAVSLNLTAVAPTSAGFLTAWPRGTPVPNTSTLNFQAGRTLANNAVLPVGSGEISVNASLAGSVHLVIDVNGWFE